MTWLWQYNATPNSAVNLATAAATNGAEVLFALKETLKQAGWVVKMSGDSLSYFAASDGITHNSTGAGGINNVQAWFRIQDPGGVREYTFQRGATHQGSRTKYSASAKFTGGAPSATVTPSAADAQILIGAGTDAAPTFATLFSASASHAHIGANNAAPYAFFCTNVTNTALTCATWIYGDGLAVGLSPAGDTDQWVTQVLSGALPLTTLVSGAAGGVGKGYYKKGLGGEAFVIYPCAWDVTQVGYCPKNPITGNEEARPILLCRTAAMGNGGYKGFTASLKVRFTAGRQIPDYFDDVGPPATRWAFFDGLAVPYPSTVLPTT